MARPAREIPKEWADDMKAVGLVDDRGNPSREALALKAKLNPSQVNNALFPDRTSSRSVMESTIIRLAAALDRPTPAIRERVSKHAKTRRLVSAEESALLDWYAALPDESRGEVDARLARGERP